MNHGMNEVSWVWCYPKFAWKYGYKLTANKS